jgi:hypothetical protein
MICGLLALAAAAVAAASARALDLPTLPQPTLPTPTLPAPTLPTPTVRTPTVPTPTVPAPPAPAPPAPAPPVSAPTAPAPTVPTPRVPAPSPPGTPQPSPAPVQTPTGAEPAPSARPSVPPSGGAGAPANRSAHPASRRALPRRPRPVVATFRVRRAALVRVAVRQVAPLCRTLGRYRYRAEPGPNRVRLPAQIGRHRLGAGTYVLVGRTLGHRVFRVVTEVRRARNRLLAHRIDAAPACAAAAPVGVLAAEIPPGPGSAGRTASAPTTPRGIFKPPAATVPGTRKSPLVRAATLEDAPAPLRPLLYALLALAIGLLAAAAAPQRMLPLGATGAFVAEKRMHLAAAGIWLVAVVAALTIFA